MWNCTNACNLGCIHCYLNAESKLPNELTTEEGRQLIEEAAELGSPLLGFTGGEPLLRDDIYELARFAVDRGLKVIISSNGTLIDKHRARKLKEAGVRYVGISLDGSSPQIHDNFRGVPGAFEMAIGGIRACLSEGIPVGIRVTISSYNFDDLPQIFDLALRLEVTRFCIYYLVPSGRGEHLMRIDLHKAQRRRLFEFLVEKSRRHREVEIITADGPMDGVYLLEMLRDGGENEVRKIMRELLRAAGGCSAGTKICGIGPEGTVHPCQFMSEVVVGNIRDSSLKEIWLKPESPLLRVLRDRSALKGKCGRCDYRDVCGGCRIRAFYAYGDYLGEDPACLYEANDE